MIKNLENLGEFLLKIKCGDMNTLNEFYHHFRNEISITYNRKIRGKYKNKYYDDYISEVNERMFIVAKKFKGNSLKAFNKYIKNTIENCAKKVLINICKCGYDIRSIESLYENKKNNFLQYSIFNVEDYVLDKILVSEVEKYLKKVLAEKEIELIMSIAINGETLKEFAARKHYKYTTIRSCKSRIAKKLKHDKLSEYLHKGGAVCFSL